MPSKTAKLYGILQCGEHNILDSLWPISYQVLCCQQWTLFEIKPAKVL